MRPLGSTFSRLLDQSHLGEKTCIVFLPIGSTVDPSMAVWTKADNKSWIIWSTIAKPSDVMRLDVRHAIGSHKRSIILAAFAFTICACDDVVSNCSAALHERDGNWPLCGLFNCCIERLLPQRRQIALGIGRHLVGGRFDCFKFSEFEDYRIAHGARAVWRLLDMISTTHHWALVSKTAPHAPEQKKVLSVFCVRRNPAVASLQGHRTRLTFTKVFKCAVFSKPVGISVMKAFIAGDYHHKRIGRGCDDTSLPLPTKPIVNVGGALIDAALLKSPLDHLTSQYLCRILAGVSQEAKTGVAFNFLRLQGTGAGKSVYPLSKINNPEKAESE